MSFLPAQEPWWVKHAMALILGTQILTNVRSFIEHLLNRKATRDLHKELHGKLDKIIKNGNGKDHAY